MFPSYTRPADVFYHELWTGSNVLYGGNTLCWSKCDGSLVLVEKDDVRLAPPAGYTFSVAVVRTTDIYPKPLRCIVVRSIMFSN
jgi:hypothetical protein